MDVAVVGYTHVPHERNSIDFDPVSGANHNVVTLIIGFAHALGGPVHMALGFLHLASIPFNVRRNRLGRRWGDGIVGSHDSSIIKSLFKFKMQDVTQVSNITPVPCEDQEKKSVFFTPTRKCATQNSVDGHRGIKALSEWGFL